MKISVETFLGWGNVGHQILAFSGRKDANITKINCDFDFHDYLPSEISSLDTRIGHSSEKLVLEAWYPVGPIPEQNGEICDC